MIEVFLLIQNIILFKQLHIMTQFVQMTYLLSLEDV